jgi:hypothetical protein
VAAEMAARPHIPPIWLRELSEGGRHLDPSIIKALADIIAGLASILDDGRREGVFRPVDTIVVQMSIIAPLLFFEASAAMRQRVGRRMRGAAIVPREALVAYLERACLSVLQPESFDSNGARMSATSGSRRQPRTSAARSLR